MRKPLREILAQTSSLTDEDFICAENGPNWTPESPAYLIHVPRFTDLQARGPIMDYFLEAFIARQILEDLSALNGREPSIDEICDAVIHYAQQGG